MRSARPIAVPGLACLLHVGEDMPIKVPYTLPAVIIIGLASACGDDGPCLEGGDVCISGETGEISPEWAECAPFEDSEDPKVGASYTCQGEGTGWLVTDIYGMPDPVTSCLAYDNIPDPPESATWQDCGWRTMATITSSYDIPKPTACCTEGALDQDIAEVCVSDCGYAAVKVAIEAIRSSADNLQPPEDWLQGAVDTSRADLYAYADFLETPFVMRYCAQKVSASPGEVVSVKLGEGPSGSAQLGHIKSATLFLSCAPDLDEPFVVDEEVLECSEPTNIPMMVEEQDSQGSAPSGSVQVTGPGVNVAASITGASFKFRETLNRDMSIDFTLVSFDAALADASAGSFEFSNARLMLAAPASGRLEGELVTFAPGTLRFAVTASVSVDGERLFGGSPSTSVYTNSGSATAVRTIDGSFGFLEAPFSAGEYAAVLNTERARVVPVK